MGPHYYFDGFGLIWALLNFIFWAAIIGLAIWAVLRLTRSSPPPRYPVGPPQTHHRESPREILDRRFASGEIDAAAYEDMRRRIESARSQSAPAPQPSPAPQSAPDQAVQGRSVQDQSEPPSGEGDTKQL
jgi:putative membrane protein